MPVLCIKYYLHGLTVCLLYIFPYYPLKCCYTRKISEIPQFYFMECYFFYTLKCMKNPTTKVRRVIREMGNAILY